MCLFCSALAGHNIVVPGLVLNIAFLGGSRFMWRLVAPFLNVLPAVQPNRPAAKNVLIIGAGDGGVLVARELRNHYKGEVRLVGFVDDDPKKQSQRILGFPVLGTKDEVPAIVTGTELMKSLSLCRQFPEGDREIVAVAQQTGKTVKILPGVFDN